MLNTVKPQALVLDVCCGGKMFYYDKNDDRVLFNDIRTVETTLCDGRLFTISPDTQYDFTKMPFADCTFHRVTFDPPHLIKVGVKSWLAIKYGKLREDWKEELRRGFAECFRVLKHGGTLVFKWNETDIKLKDVLELTTEKPIDKFGFGKAQKTRVVTFIKTIGGEL